ncbi:MAG: nucleotidyl transferase AbiEii/AbiGii toxin family protein [Myxococcota bacterium]
MTKKPITNMGASVRARLKALAKRDRRPLQEVLQYYAMERFLYRLSQSSHRERFVLKGALMLQFWGAPLVRSTKDIDLCGRQTATPVDLVRMVKDCLAVPVDDDGLRFHTESVIGEPIRTNAKYDGVRLRFRAELDGADVRLQVDVGFGDAITPGPQRVSYPSLLGFEGAHLLGYTPETAVAEKFEAMVALDMANTRMKDFFDVWLLASKWAFSSEALGKAIEATFRRRRTALPLSAPTALTPVFHSAPEKQVQWRAYLKKGHVREEAPAFEAAARLIRDFLMPVSHARANGLDFTGRWPPGGPWTSER